MGEPINRVNDIPMWIVIKKDCIYCCTELELVGKHDSYDEALANTESLYYSLYDYSDVSYHMIEVV